MPQEVAIATVRTKLWSVLQVLECELQSQKILLNKTTYTGSLPVMLTISPWTCSFSTSSFLSLGEERART